MFHQLLEIEKLSKTTSQMEESKDRLNTLLVDSYTSEPTVKNSLADAITNTLTEANSRAEMFARIQEDALQGFLVPSFIDFDDFNKNQEGIPQWTRVVFEKQFEKQKQSLDILAKKTYSAHYLSEAKDKHLRQLNCFKILADRYKALSQHEQTLDIMTQAQKLRNLTKLTSEKFKAYLGLVSSKLTSFLQEVTSKCQQFSGDLNQMAVRTNTSPFFNQKPPKVAQYEQTVKYSQGKVSSGDWLSRANRTLDNFKGQHQFLLRQPRWLNTYSSDYYC